MQFYDMNGTKLQTGDHILSKDGRELLIIKQEKPQNSETEIIVGEDEENVATFCALTHELLNTEWIKKEE